MRKRLVAAAASLAVCATALAVPAGPAAAATAAEYRDSSGFIVINHVQQEAPAPPAARALLDTLVTEALSNPDDLAPPWWDAAKQTVVQGHATAAGQVRLAGATAAGRQAVAAPRVVRSWAALDRIQDDLVNLRRLRQPGTESIVLTYPDPRTNRVVIVTDQLARPLFATLAKGFATDAVAVRPIAGLRSELTGRQSDTSPYYGGAKITNGGGCTSGFAWRVGTQHAMVTAGHCIYDSFPQGVYAPSGALMGTVSSTEDNYRAGTGSIKINGQSSYYGDLALVRMSASSAAKIFVGSSTSSTSAWVSEMGGWSVMGDQFCTGGQSTGEICGWSVQAANAVFYNPNGEVTRNMVWSYQKGNPCTAGGDSGGPVYWKKPDGTIGAKGIINARNYALVLCNVMYTDIRAAFTTFPGTLATG
jgi:hypothetical protein